MSNEWRWCQSLALKDVSNCRDFKLLGRWKNVREARKRGNRFRAAVVGIAALRQRCRRGLRSKGRSGCHRRVAVAVFRLVPVH